MCVCVCVGVGVCLCVCVHGYVCSSLTFTILLRISLCMLPQSSTLVLLLVLLAHLYSTYCDLWVYHTIHLMYLLHLTVGRTFLQRNGRETPLF